MLVTLQILVEKASARPPPILLPLNYLVPVQPGGITCCTTSMRPLEYGIVDQSEDGFDNDDSSQRRPSSSTGRHRRQRFPSLSVRVWILFGAVVAIGVVAIGKLKSQQLVNNNAEDDYSQSPGNSLASSGAENGIASNGSAEDEVVDEDENDSDAPTPVPVALQDITATDITTPGQTCDQLFDCISDRLGQNEPMSAGQAICSRDGRYAFAMELSQSNNSVSLVWKDCGTGETKNYYRKGDAGDYFTMDENANFAVHGSEGQIKWEKDCRVSVKRYPQCLSKPMYDCPYLHLHRGGVVVLNYIDGWDWISRNIKKMYDF